MHLQLNLEVKDLTFPLKVSNFFKNRFTILPKSAKFLNNGKNNPPSGAWVPAGGRIFLLILVSSISYLYG